MYFLIKYFCERFCEILTSGSRGEGVFPRKLFHIQSHYYACVAFNWVLPVTKKNLRVAGYFALIPNLFSYTFVIKDENL